METTDAPTDQPEQPQPETPPGPSSERRLTRSRHDRMLAGVAGGIGEYFDIDPAIIRIGFVALTIFGGSGVLLYLLGWLLIPEQGGRGSLLGRPHRIGRGTLAVLILVAVLATVHPWRGEWHPWSWPLVLVGGGLTLLLLSRRDRRRVACAPGEAADEMLAPPVPAAPSVPSVTPYLIAGLALLGGIAALTGLTATAALAICLVLAGAALVAGALRGRMGATPVLVVLAGVGLIVSLVAPRGLGDGIGNRTFQPASTSELQSNYRLGIGHLVVDLSALHGAVVPIKARLGIGQLMIIVPAGATVSIHEHAGIGGTAVFGGDQGGMVVDRTAVSGVSAGIAPDFRLDAEVGIGRVQVERAAA